MKWVKAAMAALAAIGAAAFVCFAGQTGSASAPQSDTSYIDASGTAHVTRVVPVPGTVSPQAQKSLARTVSDAPSNETLAQRRSHTDKWQAGAGEESRKLYPVNIAKGDIAG